jgi:DNA-binding LacI/PurR family transcriptional regulator
MSHTLTSTEIFGDTRPRHQQIAQTLRHQIHQGDLNPGQALPSYRSLMSSFQVTVGTVRQAMLALQTEGLVQSVPGVGCVVSDARTSGALRHHVGMVIVGNPELPWLLQQVAASQEMFESLQGDLIIRLLPELTPESLERLLDWARRQHDVILVGTVPVSLARQLVDQAGSHVTMIGEFHDAPCPADVSQVTVDLLSIGSLAVTHLVSLGHRRIAFCLDDRPIRYNEMLVEGFNQSMAEYRLSDSSHVWRRPRMGDHLYAAELIAWIKQQKLPPTALIVEQGRRAAAVISLLRESQMAAPGGISLLGISDVEAQRKNNLQLSSILPTSQNILTRTLEILHSRRQARSQRVHTEKMLPSYCLGQTTEPPPA